VGGGQWEGARGVGVCKCTGDAGSRATPRLSTAGARPRTGRWRSARQTAAGPRSKASQTQFKRPEKSTNQVCRVQQLRDELAVAHGGGTRRVVAEPRLAVAPGEGLRWGDGGAGAGLNCAVGHWQRGKQAVAQLAATWQQAAVLLARVAGLDAAAAARVPLTVTPKITSPKVSGPSTALSIAATSLQARQEGVVGKGRGRSGSVGSHQYTHRLARMGLTHL
jgi:hypothetical protein